MELLLGGRARRKTGGEELDEPTRCTRMAKDAAGRRHGDDASKCWRPGSRGEGFPFGERSGNWPPLAVRNVKWTSKNHFAAKRLRTIAARLTDTKRAVIEENSAFRALLNIAPFIIPNELIDYVAHHTTPGLREFKVGKKRILFTADMITKVFGIRSGPRLVVLLKRSEHHAMRDVYRGSSPRPDIPTAIKQSKTLRLGQKRMHSQRMSALLNDVDAALKEADGPSVVFPPGAAAHAGGNTNANFVSEQQGAATEGGVPNAEGEVDDIMLDESEDDDTDEDDEERDDEPMRAATYTIVPIVPLRSVAADVPQSVVMTDSSCLGGDIACIHVACTVVLDKDVPTVEVVDIVTPSDPKTIGVITIESTEKDSTSGFQTHEKKNMYKRAAKSNLTPPKMKKIKDKLIVDPSAFDLDSCMKELELVNPKFKILKDDLFANFNTLVIASNLSTYNFSDFTLTTPDHPQQTTLFDCGFFSQLFMDNFEAKVMAHFDNNATLTTRRLLQQVLLTPGTMVTLL
ncbi:hypothetical protein ACQ4PT_060060 [Festuca glaucescens]